jgi:hypothetical protein
MGEYLSVLTGTEASAFAFNRHNLLCNHQGPYPITDFAIDGSHINNLSPAGPNRVKQQIVFIIESLMLTLVLTTLPKNFIP